MTNAFYAKTGNPGNGSFGSSATIRAEFSAIEAAFDKLPTLSGNASKIVSVNSGASALTVTDTTGSGNVVLATSPTLVTPAFSKATNGDVATFTNGTRTGYFYAGSGTVSFMNAAGQTGEGIVLDANSHVIYGFAGGASVWSTSASAFNVLNGYTVNLTGPVNITGDLALNSSKFTVASSSGNTVVAGTLGVAGNFAVATSKFTVAASSGNTAVAGTLAVTGTSTFTGAITASGGVTGALTGNASTATALATARAINGVNFDGTAAITVTAAAGTLSGNTLAAGVTASSLTSVGTLTSLDVSGSTSLAALSATTGAFSGQIGSSNSVLVALDGSGSPTSGAWVGVANTAKNRFWIDQLGASNERLTMVYNGTAWSTQLSLSSSTFAITPAVTMASDLTVSGGIAGAFDLVLTKTTDIGVQLTNSGASGKNWRMHSTNSGEWQLTVPGVIDLMTATTSGLSVTGALSATGEGAFGFINTTGSNAGVNFHRRDTDAAAWTMYAPDGSIRLYNGADRFIVDSSGNFGLGTTSPTSIGGYTALAINNDTNGAILDLMQGGTMRGRLIGTTSAAAIETSGALPILFSPGGTEKFRVTTNGARAVLPTSSAGLSAGDLWNNGGVVNIV